MSERWRAASTLYRSLLWLYPRHFRRLYGAEMAETFRGRLTMTLESTGRRRAMIFCLTNYIDAARTALAERISSPAAHGPGGSVGGWRLDLRHAFRTLIARPGFSLVVVLTLALAIGANTAMFSVLQAVLLNPPPFREPDRIVVLGERSASIDTEFVSPITYDDWKTRNEAFEELAAFRYWENLPMPFERGLDRSFTSRVWIGMNGVNRMNARRDLMRNTPQVAELGPIRSGGAVYAMDLHMNAHRFFPYGDESLDKPDVVLADFVSILHPELVPGYEPAFIRRLP